MQDDTAVRHILYMFHNSKSKLKNTFQSIKLLPSCINYAKTSIFDFQNPHDHITVKTRWNQLRDTFHEAT